MFLKNGWTLCKVFKRKGDGNKEAARSLLLKKFLEGVNRIQTIIVLYVDI